MLTRRDILKLGISVGGLLSSKTAFAAYITVKKINTSTHIDKEDQINQLPLNPRYTFDNFIAGANNRFALEAALDISSSPKNKYNPLFIYGGEGMGKTHLISAIGNSLLKGKPDIVIRYATLAQFSNDLKGHNHTRLNTRPAVDDSNFDFLVFIHLEPPSQYFRI